MITKKENRSAKRLSILSAVLFGGAIFSIGMHGVFSAAIPSGGLAASVPEAFVQEISALKDPFENITLEARAAYVLDLTTGKALFSRNENDKLPLASITKIMTAFVAREHISPGGVITVTKDDLMSEGDSGLRSGERWRMEDLLDVMLVISSNDAARAIASFVGSREQTISDGGDVSTRAYFVKMMNEKAHSLGFNTMEFFNESGLDKTSTNAGGYGSARETALLFAELWKKYPTVMEITTRKDAVITSQDGIAHILPNTNEELGHFPGIIGSKTGYTALAGGNLAIIFDMGIGRPVVAVVLGSTYKGRFDDMQKLVQATLKTWE